MKVRIVLANSPSGDEVETVRLYDPAKEDFDDAGAEESEEEVVGYEE